MKKINVKLFGAFKSHVPEGFISISIDGSQTTENVKNIIFAQLVKHVPTFSDQNLVNESALATSDVILGLDDLVEENAELALLPPVCGG